RTPLASSPPAKQPTAAASASATAAPRPQQQQQPPLRRRTLSRLAWAAAVVAVAVACARLVLPTYFSSLLPSPSTASPSSDTAVTAAIANAEPTMAATPPTAPRLPAYFLAHGNPYWLVTPTESGPRFLSKLGRRILQWPAAARPRAVLIVSAHWETSPGLRVTSVQKHKLLYDYYGFPDSFYDIQYPADGEPEVAAEASRLLSAAGFAVANETKRGLDHGAFTPLLYL
ncbi:hypothetical protein HK405_001147, partial [Cladochytrium tenue]